MARNSSATSRCTRARVCARQTCPDRPRVTVPMVIAAAVDTSASANTSAGLLPPSSRLTRLNPSADAAMILRPTARLPVNDSLFTIGWLISASPVGLARAGHDVQHARRAARLPRSGGPAGAPRTSRTPTAWPRWCSRPPAPGRPSGRTAAAARSTGLTAPTTPTGSRRSWTRWSPPWYGGSVSPASLSTQPAWWSKISATKAGEVA